MRNLMLLILTPVVVLIIAGAGTVEPAPKAGEGKFIQLMLASSGVQKPQATQMIKLRSVAEEESDSEQKPQSTDDKVTQLKPVEASDAVQKPQSTDDKVTQLKPAAGSSASENKITSRPKASTPGKQQKRKPLPNVK